MDILSSKILSGNLKKFRQQHGWSQDQMSRAANIPYSTYVKIESGNTPNPSIQTAINIADALKISLDELVGRTPTK